jgi:predicted MFS family arabinose efflux permease
VYLVKVLDFSPELTALAYVLLGVSGLLMNPTVARAVDTGRATTLLAWGLAVQAAGFFVIAVGGHQRVVVLAGITMVGAGNGVVFTSRVPALVQIFGQERLDTMLAIQNGVTNLSLGLGAILGVAFVTTVGPTGFGLLFALNGISFLGFSALVAVVCRSSPTMDKVSARGLPPFKTVLLPFADPNARLLLLIQGCASLFGGAQLASVIPVVLSSGGGSLTVGPLGLLFLTNCFAVAALQLPARRVQQFIGALPALLVALGGWLLLYATTAAVDVSRLGPLAVALFVAGFGLIFAASETLLAPSLQPLIMRAAPPDRLGVYAGSAALGGAVAATMGPPLGFLLLGHLGYTAYWTIAATGMLVALLSATRQRSLSAETAPSQVT